MIQLLEKGELNPSQISRDHHVTRSLLLCGGSSIESTESPKKKG
jgi:hypothetical protein